MPLLDHFHAPLAGRRHWEAFHSQWASCIASALNADLPPDYFAEAQVHAGPRIEVDIATWNEPTSNGNLATLPQTQPILAPADLTLPATFPPEFGIHIYETSGGPTLVAAIELVSPGNKDRIETRNAFATKCAAYIQSAIGLIVVDIVTNRSSLPFADLLRILEPNQTIPPHGPLMASSYRPTRIQDADTLEIRHRSFSVGDVLPVLPLALGGVGWLNVDLDASYEEARERSRL
jgi:Protein of unknown function (DUF4058)